MTRQQRQKQLMTHVLIAVIAIVAAIVIIAFCVRSSNRSVKSADAAAGNEAALTTAAVSSENAADGAAGMESSAAGQGSGVGSEDAVQNTAAAGTADSDAVQNTAAAGTADNTAAQGTAAAGTADSDAAQGTAADETADNGAAQGTATAATTNTSTAQTGSAAGETTEEEPVSGPGLADQSLVEKLSVEAKKNLETEKVRLEKEEEERQRIAEEEAKKAEVKDRDELSEISIEELAEYLRNKEVPEELIEFMEEYPEAREFVTDYLYQPDPPLSKDISGEVQKGVFPHFLQWDERWGYEDYGGSFFAVAGCGPTAMSVVYSGLTGKSDMNPYKMSQWAEEQGYYIVGEGTSWEMMWSGANNLGLYWWEVDFDETSIRSALDSGCPIIAAMSPGGDFTTFGHFIVMTDIDSEGNITIRDSNSNERTDRTWTWDELMWQTAAMWAYNYVDYEDDGSGYDNSGYYDSGYDDGSYDNSGYDSGYGDTGYEESGYDGGVYY